jgi:hypothetical protein
MVPGVPFPSAPHELPGAYPVPSVSPADSSLTASLSISPGQLQQGGSISVTTSVSGGTPPYSYSYTGLPSGCSSQDQPLFSCTPSSTGSFSVQVTVTDSHGNSSAPSNSVSVDITSSNNGNGNGNGGGNNSSTGLSSLFSGFSGILSLLLIFGVVGFITWILLIVGIWIIAITLVRRLPKRGAIGAAGATAKCGACSAVIPAGSKFCPECGAGTAPKVP